MTMLELIVAVQDVAKSDAEVVATVVHLVNSGIVRLSGSFRGATFALPSGSSWAA
jgi:hypothetical protein